MNIIFQIDGGMGKCIAATAVCKAIKKQYPADDLIVISGYPEVFLCIQGIKVYNFNDMRYFYEQFVEGKEYKVLAHNPYLETAFIKGDTHVIKVWCDMFGIPYNGEQPELLINDRERNFFGNHFATDKPVMLIQTNGGGKDQPNKYFWTRDIPMVTAQKIVDAFAQQYTIIHIRRPDQLELQNVITVPSDLGFRAMAVLIARSAKRLFIDSFAQHAAAALGKPSVVCMVEQEVANRFGYDMHTNIIANTPPNKPELRYSVLSKYNISGQPTEFPYNNEREIYDADQIIEELRKDNSYEGKSAAVKNVYINEKIQQQNNMVSNRLKFLAGIADLSNTKQIVDVGSWHLGQSIEFSNIFPDARIDAFEPVPDSYTLCMNNHSQLEGQKKDRIRVHNVALSNEPGDVPFFVIEKGAHQNIDEGFSSMFRFTNDIKAAEPLQKEITVKADTLDNWCKTNKITEVDILWMDAQGSELLVLQGAEKILKNTEIIMTEVGLKPYYEGHTLKPDIDQYLTTLGFHELKPSFELNGFDYEANTIYLREN